MPRIVPSDVRTAIERTSLDRNQPNLIVDHSSAGVLMGISRLVDQIPSELFTIGGHEASDLVCALEAIKSTVAFWQQKGEGWVSQAGIGGRNALKIVYDLLARCPDQMPSPATAELSFIADPELRNSIRLDISTATSARCITQNGRQQPSWLHQQPKRCCFGLLNRSLACKDSRPNQMAIPTPGHFLNTST
jgi:hypothetical protein